MSDNDLMAERVRKSQEWSDAGSTVNIEWPIVSGGGWHGKKYCIQYTEERWETMLGILNKIRELRKGINRLLASEKGWLQLAVVAQTRMLGDGTKKSVDE